jgi:hypothetical protein
MHPVQVQHRSTNVLLSFLASGNCRWQENSTHPLRGWLLIFSVRKNIVLAESGTDHFQLAYGTHRTLSTGSIRLNCNNVIFSLISGGFLSSETQFGIPIALVCDRGKASVIATAGSGGPAGR